ncbi:alpha/beta fold hydrolase [Amycolatopsis pithecellobii]|uniref:Alpha/beta fold hydrolase n=1 Tax=Amycolatopsis pithecellobii TaxID=664692 RepID=A0A6N7ZDA3_9PSEU|nr:alpha/beta hydrolase [Amycolatopsis pithecellobii]MTD59617.1 alpha/beta fold hydrolase [Amycolatopsis pithecellobii]
MTAPTGASRTIELSDGLTISIDEKGDAAASEGSAALLLHGGAGPFSVAGFAGALSEHAYVITPTHPGFGGTPKPEWMDNIADLATAYLDMLDVLNLSRVLVIGNSIGGWIASEMAVRDNHQRIGGLALFNAVGIQPGHPDEIAEASKVGPGEFLRLAWHKPEFTPDPAQMSDEQRAAMAANQEVLAVYAGDPYMHDPKLSHRLHRVQVPVLVGWGEHDGVVPADYGRTYAGLFPRGSFQLIPNAGHLPHVEELGLTLEALGKFVSSELQAG